MNSNVSARLNLTEWLHRWLQRQLLFRESSIPGNTLLLTFQRGSCWIIQVWKSVITRTLVVVVMWDFLVHSSPAGDCSGQAGEFAVQNGATTGQDQQAAWWACSFTKYHHWWYAGYIWSRASFLLKVLLGSHVETENVHACVNCLIILKTLVSRNFPGAGVYSLWHGSKRVAKIGEGLREFITWVTSGGCRWVGTNCK